MASQPKNVTEQFMRKELIKHFDRNANITPIETGQTMRGVPDLHIRSNSCDWFVELKQVKAPAKDSTPIRVPFRAGQLSWMEAHERKGGHCALIVYLAFEYFIVVSVWNMRMVYANKAELIELSEYHGSLIAIPTRIWDHDYTKR